MCALTGLYHRNITGQGQHIDLSQMVASVPLNGPALLDFTVNGRGSRRAGYPPGNRAHWPDTPLVNNYRGQPLRLTMLIALIPANITTGVRSSVTPTRNGSDWCR
jgi:crotonobetainyl-CoA:carnitine CoA-transferase CaiB-like acyl-CoA transferase